MDRAQHILTVFAFGDRRASLQMGKRGEYQFESDRSI